MAVADNRHMVLYVIFLKFIFVGCSLRNDLI